MGKILDTRNRLLEKRGASSSRANPSTGSNARRSANDVSEYRTAELSNANRSGNCVGLTAEWLLVRKCGTASERMEASKPGSRKHMAAAHRQLQYHNTKAMLRSRRAEEEAADLQAHNTVLQQVNLSPSEVQKKYKFADADRFMDLLNDITRNGAVHLVGLYFADGSAHTVATSTSGLETTLFDPNHGEFTAPSYEADRLLMALARHYQNVSTISTQKID